MPVFMAKEPLIWMEGKGSLWPEGRQTRIAGSAGPRGETPVGLADVEGEAEGLGQPLRGEHFADRSGADHAALREEKRVREAPRDLFHVVGDHDDARRERRARVAAEQLHELLACSEVEARGRLVEQQ